MAGYMVRWEKKSLNMSRNINNADVLFPVPVVVHHPEDVTEHVPATMSGILFETRIQGYTKNYAPTGQVTRVMTIGKI